MTEAEITVYLQIIDKFPYWKCSQMQFTTEQQQQRPHLPPPPPHQGDTNMAQTSKSGHCGPIVKSVAGGYRSWGNYGFTIFLVFT